MLHNMTHTRFFTIIKIACVIIISFNLAGCASQIEICRNVLILKSARISLTKSIGVYAINSSDGSDAHCYLPKNLGAPPRIKNDKWMVYSTDHIGSPEYAQVYAYSIVDKTNTQITNEKNGARNPDLSERENLLAYEGDDGIYLINIKCLDTNITCNLPSTYLTLGINPALSPNGEYIAYIDYSVDLQKKVKVMNIKDKKNILDITPPNTESCSRPRWSPDGERIAVACYLDDNFDIFVVERDGSLSVNITNTPEVFEVNPDWSPDGSKIAFISNGDKDLGKCLTDECTLSSTAVYTINNDGTSLRRLTLDNTQDVLWVTWLP